MPTPAFDALVQQQATLKQQVVQAQVEMFVDTYLRKQESQRRAMMLRSQVNEEQRNQLKWMQYRLNFYLDTYLRGQHNRAAATLQILDARLRAAMLTSEVHEGGVDNFAQTQAQLWLHLADSLAEFLPYLPEQVTTPELGQLAKVRLLREEQIETGQPVWIGRNSNGREVRVSQIFGLEYELLKQTGQRSGPLYCDADEAEKQENQANWVFDYLYYEDSMPDGMVVPSAWLESFVELLPVVLAELLDPDCWQPDEQTKEYYFEDAPAQFDLSTPIERMIEGRSLRSRLTHLLAYEHDHNHPYQFGAVERILHKVKERLSKLKHKL